MRAIILLILSLLFVVPGVAQNKKNDVAKAPPTPPPTPYSTVQRDGLLNGLSITMRRDPGAPFVKMNLILRTGAMFDLSGKTGTAKLTQETLLGANPKLVEEFESFNGKISWKVDHDTTQFYIEVPANDFNTAIELLGRLLVVDTINTDSFKSAHDRQLEHVKAAEPGEGADAFFFKSIYGDHPYGRSIDGSTITLANIKQADVLHHMQRFYLANNSAVIIEGNISVASVLKPFKTYFGGWEKAKIIPSTFRPPQPKSTPSTLLNKDTLLPNLEIRAGVEGLKASDPDFLITEVMARILHNKFTEHAATVKSYQGFLAAPLMMSLNAPVSHQQSTTKSIAEVFHATSNGKITDEELSVAKSWLVQYYAGRSIFDNLVNIETYKLPRNFPLEVQGRIEKITIVDINRVAAKLFNANTLTITISGNVDGLQVSR